jgi:hypothetical protein
VVASSPFLLNATIQHHPKKYHVTQPQIISNSIYADDIVIGTDSLDSAYQLYIDSNKIFKDGGFNLCKFTTNHVSLGEKLTQQKTLFLSVIMKIIPLMQNNSWPHPEQ